VGMSVIKNPIAEEIKVLERVSEKCPDAIVRIAEDGKILYANPASEPLLHCWNHEVGQCVSDDWKQLISDTFEYGEPRQTEIDCGKIVFSFHIVPLLDDRCVIVYGRDVTERKRANRELRQNEERFALVLRGTNDGIWDFDLRNGEIHFSPRWKEMLGYEEHEVANHFKAWQDLIHPDDLGQVLEIWTNCMGGFKDSFALEYRMRTKSGDWMWVQCRGLALQDGNLIPIRLAGSHTDISERKRAQEALSREKELAQVTLHSIGDAVVTTDIEGNIDYMNPVAERLTGWQLEEARGLPSSEVLQLISEITGEPVDDPIKGCMGSDRNTDMDGHIVLVNRDGTEFTIKDSIAPIRDRDENIVGVVMVFDNVSEERQLQSQLTWQKAHDGLTGLFNRREFERRLALVLEKSCQENSEHALLYLDLDQFRIVNDTCGHMAGDVLIKHLATIVEDQVRDADIVARLGGDEFGVLLQRCPIEQAKDIANTLRQSIKEFHFAWEGKTFQIGASVGVVSITAGSGSLAEVLTAADMACYKAKDLGRNRICVYEAGDSDILRRFSEMQWVTRITDALKTGRFRLYYQAMAPYSPDEPDGEHYEIFIRMLDEDGKMIAPKDFLPAAERYNLMPAIDRWVVGATLTALGTQAHAMDNLSTCSINLSGDSLNDDSLLQYISDQLQKNNVPPELICFEITETAAIGNLSQALIVINGLKKLGCRFALDDFGSGLSSFGYLKTLPVDYLKIDGSFVRDIVNDPVDCAMVKSINEVGHAMGKQTIAEWAENEATLKRLEEIGVDYAQGYAISIPKPFMQSGYLNAPQYHELSESLAGAITLPDSQKKAG